MRVAEAPSTVIANFPVRASSSPIQSARSGQAIWVMPMSLTLTCVLRAVLEECSPKKVLQPAFPDSLPSLPKVRLASWGRSGSGEVTPETPTTCQAVSSRP